MSTQMTAPKSENKTEMVAKKLVKIKVLRDIRVTDEKGEEHFYKPEAVIMVTEEQAKEFCDKAYDGYFPYRGERFHADGTAGLGKVYRAQRV